MLTAYLLSMESDRWLQIYHIWFKKFTILKKGIGIESQNLCKQVKDQKVWKQFEVGIELNVCYKKVIYLHK